jgi:hypothetical protein
MNDSVRRDSQKRHCDSTLKNKYSVWKKLSTGNNFDRFDKQFIAFAAIDAMLEQTHLKISG